MSSAGPTTPPPTLRSVILGGNEALAGAVMVRYGDQEQSSPGGAQFPPGAPQAPAARTPREPARREGASAPDGPTGGEARLAEQDDTRQVPHPRQAPSRRAGLL